MKYSDQLAEWLVQLGYRQCFFVGGGNIMHLIESLSRRMACHAVVHEVAAGIAAEYYNETSDDGRALALVTAGPGLTNIVTAMAGAYLESRELLVIGGQVKTSDLSGGVLRQRGIQEINGTALAGPVCNTSVLLKQPVSFREFSGFVVASRLGRKGPVFIEIPLDVQAREYSAQDGSDSALVPAVIRPRATPSDVRLVADLIRAAKRPLFLIGGGLSRASTRALLPRLTAAGVPVATTWNGADRIGAENPVYVGRPNTWGQRSANLVLQQSDLLIAMGTRLGMQQTGFNWQQFVPGGKVVQVDIDADELAKGHPRVDYPLHADANEFFAGLLEHNLGQHSDWLLYARMVRKAVPLIEPVNTSRDTYISPYVFVDRLAAQCCADDIVIPCSSGGAFTVMMQAFTQQQGQLLVTNKGLASMGYGLSGAIGAAFAHPERRVVLVEGDGGFAQNMQEIGTAKINALNLKMFVFDDSGYASIRMTQKNYFGGRYVGCDIHTGLGLPNWEQLFKAWDVPVCRLGPDFPQVQNFHAMFQAKGTAAFIVSIDPEQTYYPKITSQITDTGTMVSNPLHRMTPELPAEVMAKIGKYLP
ncbi:thiamine pyrophosphate-requiring enzyme [Serpentinimonas maccroryi]|uniref:Thiamine pyrophosphate-requiring enzyme n=1 Tax=Serpentinimonas maccroryi TaxID=1458426 RepID=A0A060NX53_9BURK|nr:thiamine pyrophosphate-binding protein [Serpentinimonas maccroryi]BAO83479.1 thiamine pyrophosphate-requiring enzyme [Serpentinimonas maccroryi]